MSALENISCRDFVVTEGYAYFSNRFYNGFFKVGIGTGRTTFLGYFQGEKLCRGNICKNIYVRNRNIYICPWKGRHVHIWDLADQSLCSVEIRKENEKVFFVDEVILGENDVFFVPNQKSIPIKKMDLESLKVTELHERSEMQGMYLSEGRDVFPYPELFETWNIERADQMAWRQVFDKVWYSFLPMGRHMLCYVEGKDKPYQIPLTVVNEKELDEHLHNVKAELLREVSVPERKMELQDFIEEVTMKEMLGLDIFGDGSEIGKEIWKALKCEGRTS